MDSEDDLVPTFIPALVALLIRAEELNGSPLTRNQVTAIRDNADCMMLPSSTKTEMEEERGYADIDPERCWEDWLIARAKMSVAWGRGQTAAERKSFRVSKGRASAPSRGPRDYYAPQPNIEAAAPQELTLTC